MEHGTDFRQKAWIAGPRRLLAKVRSQPLRRLPVRVCRRLLRDVRAMLLA